MTARIESVAVSKNFGGSHALRDVSVAVERDTFHALVGENGAGKSTLGRIFAGLQKPSAGTLRVDGEEVRFGGPRDALSHGVTMVVQERTIVPGRSVLDNVLLGRELGSAGMVSKRQGLRRYAEVCDLAGFELDPGRLVGTMRPAERLRVEILRALARDVDLLVLDEVTSALAPDEAQAFFDLLRHLRSRKRTIVYVTHFLNEVVEFADTVSILREGRVVRTGDASAESPASLISAMLGRELESVFPPKAAAPPPDAPIAFSVQGLSRRGVLKDVSFQVREGEILGLAGLVGSGRTEIARAVFGADRRDSGVLELAGKPVRIRRPSDAIHNRMALIPESRQHDGLVLGMSVGRNITLTHLNEFGKWGFISRRRERTAVNAVIQRFDVRTRSADLSVGALSGGNQQKAMFAKWLLREPRVLIADEPTRGVDIGAKQAIYEILNQLASQGVAIILISSEFEEILSLSHRVLVIRNGVVMSELEANMSRREAVLQAAFGEVAMTDHSLDEA